MNAETLEALKASIEKWERNAVAETPEQYLTRAFDCPLCNLFYNDACIGCPVSEKTFARTCRETPYIEASLAKSRWFDYDPAFDAADPEALKAVAHKHARAEVAFLESLLPKEA